MIEKYKRTNLFIIDEEVWNWAQYRSKTLGYRSTSEYLFDLIKLDRNEDLLGKEKRVEKRANH